MASVVLAAGPGKHFARDAGTAELDRSQASYLLTPMLKTRECTSHRSPLLEETFEGCLDVHGRPIGSRHRVPVVLRERDVKRGIPPLALKVADTQLHVRTASLRNEDGMFCASVFLPNVPQFKFRVTGAWKQGLRMTVRPGLGVFVRSPSGAWFCDVTRLSTRDACREQGQSCSTLDIPMPEVGQYVVFAGSAGLVSTPDIRQTNPVRTVDVPTWLEPTAAPEGLEITFQSIERRRVLFQDAGQ